MLRSEKLSINQKPFYLKKSFIIVISCILAIIALYFISQSLIKIEAPKQDLGKKVTIKLPSGKSVFTYENLIVKENGKLYYKGERTTIDLTGGIMFYDDWESK